MSYSTEISKTLSETLARFATLNSHQLAGHAANVDFWLAEIQHCIEVIDGYRERFEAMRAGQMDYVAARSTVEFSYVCEGYCEICAEGKPAHPPKRVPDKEFKEALQALRDAAYRFLTRCYKTDLIGERRFRDAADSIGTGVDVRDLKR